ncbi:MAG: helix-turn-helix transcriptional regulator [Lentisphaerae bacterium]|nr:helix-turn-helix transcriptional regulator [Lentisphaerota bacterium]
MSDLAQRFGTTHARLCRLFKRYADCPPHNYLLQRKMTHALNELQQHQRSVSEIATESGFADPYSFSKTFKRVMGYSPSQARSVRPHSL